MHRVTAGIPSFVAFSDPRWRRASVGAVAGFVLLLPVFWPTLRELTLIWTSNSYQYAWLVVPTLVYVLGWQHRAAIAPWTPQPGYGGLILALAAALLWAAASLMDIALARHVALLLALHGVLLSALGWGTYRRWWPALALSILIVPGGDLVQPLLRHLTVRMVTLFPVVAGLPYQVDGFVVVVAGKSYIVVEDCSGLSHFLLALFLGASFGALLYRSATKVAALALVGACLGVLSNLLRVNAVVAMDWWQGSQMPLSGHTTIQWVVLLALLGVFFMLLTRLAQDAKRATKAAIEPVVAATCEGGTERVFAPVAAGLLVAMMWVGVVLLTRGEGSKRPAEAMTWPPQLGGWEFREGLGAWLVDAASHSQSVYATYQYRGREIRVALEHSLARDSKLTRSEPEPETRAGWRKSRTDQVRFCGPEGCTNLNHQSWVSDNRSAQREVYYVYSLGQFATNSRLALRAQHGWLRMAGIQGTPSILSFSIDGGPVPEDALAPLVQAMLAAAASRSP